MLDVSAIEEAVDMAVQTANMNKILIGGFQRIMVFLEREPRSPTVSGINKIILETMTKVNAEVKTTI
jgi:hypothetical protein